MASIGDVTRPAFAYDSATDTWVPVGIGPHSHTASGVGAVATSSFAAKGDLLVGTGAGTLVAQTVGANGTVLTANSAQADGVEWAAVASSPIKQIVTATLATTASTTSSSLVDTGLTATITPSSTSSKIIATYCSSLATLSGTGTSMSNIYAYTRLYRGATSLVYVTHGLDLQPTSNYKTAYLPFTVTTVDSPASTSALTYKVQYSAGTTMTFDFSNGTEDATLILMEI
jgi:hypothetical protein